MLVNFFDRYPAGQHLSQFAPYPYIAPISIRELSVMTHTGSFLLKSTGFNIGDHIAIVSGQHYDEATTRDDPRE